MQQRSSIPIPKILDWSDNPLNAIGSEYILMEHAVGVQLHLQWPFMAGGQQIECIDALYRKVKQVADMQFPAYGSLYSVNAPVQSAAKLFLNSEYYIGPHCGAMYWYCNVGEPCYYHNARPNQGLWSDLSGHSDGLIDTGVSRIPPDNNTLPKRPRYFGSIETHLHLLETSRPILKRMSVDPRIRNAAPPTLFHPDLHKRNIFVSEDDPTVITDIIDWQSASVEPAFWHADEIPDFARATAHPSLDPNSDRCAKAFDVCTQFLVPKLAGPRLLDENLFRPFLYCYRTWKDGVTAFRHEIIETSQRWSELGFEGPCPIPSPSAEELAAHQKDYQLFEAAQNLRQHLARLLNTSSDGWVSPEDWEATESAHKEMFDGMLQAVLNTEDPDDDEPIKEEGDLRAIWPFDL